MGTESLRVSADFLWECRKANRLLQKMDLYEDFAVLCGKTVCGQEAYRRRYRELLGIDPEKRTLLRERLASLRDGQTVEDMVQSVSNEDQPNGVSRSFA